jgi:hypothetical protein
VARGQEVTRGLIEKLKIFGPTLVDADWIRVIVEAPAAAMQAGAMRCDDRPAF